MASREELGRSLLECLKDVSLLLRHAQTVAVEEQKALVENDAEAIVRCCRAQDEIIRRTAESDRRAAELAERLAAFAGLDADTADAAALAEAAGYPYDHLIRSEMDTISHLSRKVHEANEINHKLLENGLDIIACCLRTLACDSGTGSYSKDAALSEAQPCVISLDRRA